MREKAVSSAIPAKGEALAPQVEQARNHVVAQAKAMYERVARTEALSAEQKAVRLKEVRSAAAHRAHTLRAKWRCQVCVYVHPLCA